MSPSSTRASTSKACECSALWQCGGISLVRISGNPSALRRASKRVASMSPPGKLGSDPDLFWLDPRGLHNGAPALDVGLDLRSEGLRRVGHRLDPIPFQALEKIRALDDGDAIGVNPAHHL